MSPDEVKRLQEKAAKASRRWGVAVFSNRYDDEDKTNPAHRWAQAWRAAFHRYESELLDVPG